ncbi:hypothetical protein HYC85_024585 [Camellia sinensis]|uniref:COP9 signalosome complex subunit 5 n=1 Tax=Camellia sinensis TaxID=4442 RepID=A0A7J7G8M3_CAMSI|nr:hypothetical protein HYC85_024585 [Camellia sinensis]
MAQQTWELENNIVTMETPSSSESDADEASQAKSQQDKPRSTDPHFFKRLKISALALPKMSWDSIIVMDAFALPVEGTETRVNAQADAYEYMVDYSQTNKQYIDVSTQMLNQQFQEPFLVVVIDPTRTVSAGKVEIGAFQTYPEGYKPADEPVSEYQTIPLNKIEDFGVHCKQSSLDCHLLDLLWNKYWVNTLSSSPLLGNKDYVAGQLSDLAEKLEQAENQLSHSHFGPLIAPSQKNERDSAKITVEQVHGLMSQVIKDIFFYSVHQLNRPHTELSGPKPMVDS